MVRNLTPEEKSASEKAKKQANKQLSEQRKALGLQIRQCGGIRESQKKGQLLQQFEAIRDVKGLPAVLQVDGAVITLDYEMFYRFIRKLKSRQLDIKVDTQSGNPILSINHSAGFYSKDFGKIELYGYPFYQNELLTNVPVVIQ